MSKRRAARVVAAIVCAATGAMVAAPAVEAGAELPDLHDQAVSAAEYIVGKAPNLFPSGADDSVTSLASCRFRSVSTG